MNERIQDKIEEIETFLSQVLDIVPPTFDEYCRDYATKAACERFFEKIIEASVDLSFLVIKALVATGKKLQTPENDRQAFDILAQEKIISSELAERLSSAKGMRNVLAHQYGKVDDIKVFIALTEKVEKDINEFLDEIKKLK